MYLYYGAQGMYSSGVLLPGVLFLRARVEHQTTAGMTSRVLPKHAPSLPSTAQTPSALSPSSHKKHIHNMDFSSEPAHSDKLNVKEEKPWNAEPYLEELIKHPLTPEDLMYCRNHSAYHIEQKLRRSQP